MKKMPTLFVREFGDRGVIKRTLDLVTPGCEWVAAGEGVSTEKVDGSCCAIIGGRLYKRYDANVQKGRKPPAGAILCQDKPDPMTGHWPCWVAVDSTNSADRWYWNAYVNTPWAAKDGTYEAVGPHFQNNPYGLDDDFLERHGRIKLKDCPTDYEGIKEYLRTHEIEGVVWHRDNGEMCKIKRSDFGLPWPVPESES
jgi:hypothetical protein